MSSPKNYPRTYVGMKLSLRQGSPRTYTKISPCWPNSGEAKGKRKMEENVKEKLRKRKYKRKSET
jgi:hypothetical protein